MEKIIILMFLFVGFVLVAGNKQLESLRVNRDRAIKIEVSKLDKSVKYIDTAYIKKLNALKIVLTKRGDLEGALEVKAEIEKKETGLNTATRALNPILKKLQEDRNSKKLKLGDTLKWKQNPLVVNKNITIYAIINTASDGVILSHGGRKNGYALYIKQKKVILGVKAGGKLTELDFPRKIVDGKDTIIIAQISKKGSMSLSVDGKDIKGRFSGKLLQPNSYLEVGNDAPRRPFNKVAKYAKSKFSGEIKELIYNLSD